LDILYLLIPLSVVLVFAFAAIFWYALKSGQFDDLEGPAIKVILDDDRPPREENLSADKSNDGDAVEGNGAASHSNGQRR